MSANSRRREVPTHIRDVYGDRLYRSSQQSRSVRVEVDWAERNGLIESYVDEGEKRWRRTLEGDGWLDGSET